VSTPYGPQKRAWRATAGDAAGDPAEDVALVAAAKRELLLHAHRHRLRREDLEDCYSQATLELVLQARGGRVFFSRRHLSNALEQRFLSRIHDRRRALGGRSPIQAAFETATPLDGAGGEPLEIVDVRAELEQLVILRHELRRLEALAQQLTADQRLVLAWQLGQLDASDFCRRFGWSPEKYRKVAQRARARLRRLMSLEDPGVPPVGGGSDGDPGTYL
jgi:DNA-directed RNA polymerase specialized sigma24 family protein